MSSEHKLEEDHPQAELNPPAKKNDEVFKYIDGPHGRIGIIIDEVEPGESSALSDLYDTIADIMVKQAKRKAAQVK